MEYRQKKEKRKRKKKRVDENYKRRDFVQLTQI